ncbi:phage tail assembly protein [Pasteurella oralis]|uniref:Phage tail assembly protein n=1 Tax=Pasteurella oralis TaxID=1071947 RepID=A0ABW4NSF6_9PAST
MAKLELQSYRTISLAFPIKNGEGKEIKDLKIRRAKVSDVKQMGNYNGSDAEKEIYMLSLLTDLVPEDFDAMDIVDYAKIQNALMDMQKGK